MLYKKRNRFGLLYMKEGAKPPDFAPCNLFPVITNTEKTSLIKNMPLSLLEVIPSGIPPKTCTAVVCTAQLAD